jgi:hypothetical protein
LAEATTALESARKLAEGMRDVFHAAQISYVIGYCDPLYRAALAYALAADAEATAQEEFDQAAMNLYAEDAARDEPLTTLRILEEDR